MSLPDLEPEPITQDLSILDEIDNQSFPVGSSDSTIKEAEWKEFISRHGGTTVSGYDPLLEILGAESSEHRTNSLGIDEINFAKAVARIGSIGPAYCEVFDTTGLSDKQIHQYARALARKKLVYNEIKKLRSNMARSAGITTDTIVDIVLEGIEMAKGLDDPKSMFAGADRLSSLLGLGASFNKNEKTNNTVIILSDEERKNLLDHIAGSRDQIIDITPTRNEV